METNENSSDEKNISDFVKKYFKKPSEISAENREKEIDEFLAILKELWLTCPNQRFGQMLYNYTIMGTPIIGEEGFPIGINDIYNYNDITVLEGLKKGIVTNTKKG